jgi:hypothetical protein
MTTKGRWCDRSVIYLNAHYTVCVTEEQFRKTLEDIAYVGAQLPFVKTDIADATVHHLVGDDGKPVSIVCMRDTYKQKLWIEVIGLLAHEAVHIFDDFCESIGESKPSYEFKAYGTQWILQQLIESFAAVEPLGAALMKDVE